MSYSLLAKYSEVIHKRYPDTKTEEDLAWEDSPFDWFRKKASATKGRIGRDFAAHLCETAGFTVGRRGMALEVNKKIVRVKLSLMWGGTLTFEQINDDDFHFLMCIGLYPDSSHGWLIPKNELLVNGELQERDGLKAQHPGDYWLIGVDVSNPYPWLAEFGGTSDALIRAIKRSL